MHKNQLSESIIFIRHHNYNIPYIQTAVNNLGGASKGASQIAGLQVFPKNSFFPTPYFKFRSSLDTTRVAFLYKKVEERAFYRISGAVLDYFSVGAEVPL